ncbi:MAG: ATP-binding protein [Bacteroidota bacterium]
MLKLTSSPNNICEVEAFVKDLVQEHGVKEELHANILISLTEAVNNAIIHGNELDESKFVEVTCKKQNKELCISVSDEGEGFDPNDIPDPTAPENIVKIGGRGVFLIKKLCDRVAFRNNGSTVEIGFIL